MKLIKDIQNILTSTYNILIENDSSIIDAESLTHEQEEHIALQADNIVLKNALREIEKVITDYLKVERLIEEDSS